MQTSAAAVPAFNFSPFKSPVRPRATSAWQMLRTILIISVILTVVVNPSALTNPRNLAITFYYTFCYSAGMSLANGFVVDWLNQRLPWMDRPLRRMSITLAASLAVSLVVIVFVIITGALLQGGSMKDLWQPGMYGQIIVPLGIMLIISLFLHSRGFLLQWREASIQAERLQKEAATARLDSLRRQVDPHFLFNSLNALTALVEEQDPKRAVRFIRQLAQVYRYVLDSEAHELTPLTDELAFAESYAYLQHTRLGEGLQVELAVPPAEAARWLVPPLALQLLLENALKHNVARRVAPLRVQVTLDAANQTLVVRNSWQPRPVPPGETSGRGLDNLRARYAFLTPRPLTAERVGEEFVATLPLVEAGALSE